MKTTPTKSTNEPRIEFQFGGAWVGFEELTGLNHPKTTKRKFLILAARAAMKVDERITRYRITEMSP